MLCFFNLAGAIHDPDDDDRPNLVWAGEEVRVEVTDARQLVLSTVIVPGVDAPAGKGK